ncbi:CCA tRNA nucleotidyltransferase [Synechococcus sp. A15-24]|uniref:CCA tRNA nucleotidyltransferase n=1 Tax=Synechococcus sp. A15-24 TaxID=1050635 RepID=UPI001644BC4E|nr:CCA tRNA nucleotidyltransferase [Synechococcus sp. A15-24]QNJ27966.1 poly(A) polymerase [Synechococcus sp. A15-24]
MDLPAVPSALLDALKAAATEAGVPRLALVGGVVRDLLLHQRHGRPWTGVPDLDWVVEGSAAHLADVLQERCGTERLSGVQHHGQFGTVALNLDGVPLDLATARHEHYPGPAQNPVVQPGSLAADLVRRDLTINAMALDLISGELIDPHGGQSDLAAGRLQFLHPGSISDDPTRVIRAARYGARLGMALGAEGLEQVGATVAAWPWSWQVGDAPETAPPALATRLRMELERLLDHEPWPIALDLLESWHAMALVDPCLQRDPERTRRLRWGQRLGLPLMTALLAAAADPWAVARRLQIPGQQQQWLERLPSLQGWLASHPLPVQASPDAWTTALERGGWPPQTVALMVTLRPAAWRPLLRWWGRWRHIQSPQNARQLIAEGWQPGPGLGEELRRRRGVLLDQGR